MLMPDRIARKIRPRHTTALALVASTIALTLAATAGAGSAGAAAMIRPRTAKRPTPIVVILMENKGVNAVAAKGSYIARFASHGRRYTNYHALTHPSLPNYLDITSGTTSGCNSDGCPKQQYPANNLFHQLDVAHGGRRGWRSYEESMPSGCSLHNSGQYAVKHNPAAYFRNLKRTCARQDVPMPRRIRSLAPFTFVTPNLCSDMHSCPVSVGDRWLRQHVPAFLALGARVIITFDEGGGNNQVFAAEAGAGIHRGVVRRRLTHFSLLAGLERHFGLRRLAGARSAAVMPV
jgi:hypothetical protein